MKYILMLLARLLYTLAGWTIEPMPAAWRKRQVIIAFPHRSNMDTVLAFAGFFLYRKRGHILIKKESFVWPFSLLLRALGGLPVNRSDPGGVVEQLAGEFGQREEFNLAMVPEGTRKAVGRMKTGFWRIAKAAGVPILCLYLDNANRQARWVGSFEPGDSLEGDLRRIQGFYRKAGHEIPLD